MAAWSGQPAIKGPSEAVRMMLLSFVTLGITFTWGIEMTFVTPYLLSLGLSKSDTSLVWIAGPFSGLVVQPIVGAVADNSTSRWGRRRPIMLVGSIIVALCLLIIGFTRQFVEFVVSDEAARRWTIVVATLAIYAVTFAINAVMSCSKSLVVDTLPLEKQQTGAAWGIGQMMSYGIGAVDLVKVFGTTLGDTQFKQLSIISSVFILASTALTCWAVTERVLVSAPVTHQGRFKVLRRIFYTLLHLPSRIQTICWAQFWAWIGWYPFVFYSTTWVGETYFRYDVPADDRQSQDTLEAIGRIGSTSLVIYSIITFAGVWVLPFLVQPSEARPRRDISWTNRLPQTLSGLIAQFDMFKSDIVTSWMIGHLIFAVSMSLAPFASSFRFATLLVSICGIPSALAMWAPSALLGIEINKLSHDTDGGTYHRITDESDIELPSLGEDTHDQLPFEGGTDANPPSTGGLSGIYFGIFNIYTVVPQFVGTLISTIVFSILEPGT
ncbi:hypothetical protein ACJ41O_014556 [Fusarium nematophilum]